MKTKNIKIALVGQPNVGKSMLINSISNSKLKVGNFSGVTVEKKEVNFKYKDFNIQIIDLPGTYSLSNYSIEEKIVKNFLKNESYDIILNVLDSTNLQRNLLLTSEILELNKKIVIALNMSDEAEKENIFIDNKKLSSYLKKPCVKVSAMQKKGITELLDTIIKSYLDNQEFFNQFYINPNPSHDEILNQKFAFVKKISQDCITIKIENKKSFTEKIDSILMHNFFGLPIFLFFMWSLFQATFTFGEIPMGYIEEFFAVLIEFTKSILGENQISSLIADGIIAGVGSVVLFLPNIIILFFGIALLESTGYMSRVSFLLDGILHRFGLHGKSFIPLVTGFGCSVPAYMAARTLKNEKDRLLTLFIIGFMSCGARLPIYVLFVGAFFSENGAGNVLFLIYISGAILGLVFAKILRVVVFKGQDEPFVMEMPKYRVPTTKLLYQAVSHKAFMYLKKAGTFILAASILIWFMSNYPKSEIIEQEFQAKIELADENTKTILENQLSLAHLENSYLGKLGHISEPFFAPLGFDWRMAVALETGLAAKEIVVSTLAILYGLGEENDEKSASLIENIKKNISKEAAISFIVFVMIYIPCLAASMVFVREAGEWKYLGYLFVFTTSSAWIISFIVYNISKLIF